MKRRVQKVYRRRKEQLRWKIFFFRFISRVLILLFLVGSVAFFGKKFYNYLNKRVFVPLSLFQVGRFEVNSGDSSLDKRLDNFLNRYIGRSIFFSSVKLKEEIIALFPEIKDVVIKRRIGGKVILSLVKREPLALVEEKNSSSQAVDQEGKFFPLVSSGEFPSVSKDEKGLQQVISFLLWLKQEKSSLYQKTKKIYTLENGNLVLFLDTGEKIIWGGIERTKEKMQHLLLVLSDLNERNRVVSSKKVTNVIDLTFYPEGGIIVRKE